MGKPSFQPFVPKVARQNAFVAGAARRSQFVERRIVAGGCSQTRLCHSPRKWLGPEFGSASPSGYTPAQIAQAYGINLIQDGGATQTGTGETIAIIDFYDDPNIVSSSSASFATSDLHYFDQMYNLPEPTGFFTKVDEYGGTNYPTAATPDPVNGSWAAEISLDVEWAHALAPALRSSSSKPTSTATSRCR